jgi:hypothetical protein
VGPLSQSIGVCDQDRADSERRRAEAGCLSTAGAEQVTTEDQFSLCSCPEPARPAGASSLSRSFGKRRAQSSVLSSQAVTLPAFVITGPFDTVPQSFFGSGHICCSLPLKILGVQGPHKQNPVSFLPPLYFPGPEAQKDHIFCSQVSRFHLGCHLEPGKAGRVS